MIILDPVIEKSTIVLLNYGAVGAMLGLCILALVYITKIYLKQTKEQSDVTQKTNENYQSQLTLLGNKLDKYIEEDRKKLMDVVFQNTVAFNKFLIVMEDVHEQLIISKNQKQ